MLFDVGVQMEDVSRKEKFTLKAIIFITITDYLGLFSLSGQIKEKTGCVMCFDETCYTYLKGSYKMVYTRHSRFLVKKHRYRRSVMNEYFDNQEDVTPSFAKNKTRLVICVPRKSTHTTTE
jgi:hypothetical protein